MSLRKKIKSLACVRVGRACDLKRKVESRKKAKNKKKRKSGNTKTSNRTEQTNRHKRIIKWRNGTHEYRHGGGQTHSLAANMLTRQKRD